MQSIHGVNTTTFPLKPLEAWTKTGTWSGQIELWFYDETEDVSPLSVWTWGSRAALFILDTGDNFFLVQSLIDTVCVWEWERKKKERLLLVMTDWLIDIEVTVAAPAACLVLETCGRPCNWARGRELPGTERKRGERSLRWSEPSCGSWNYVNLPFPLAVSLSFWEVKGWMCCLVLRVRSQRHRSVDRRAVGGLRVGVGSLLLRLGGGGWRVGALTGTAAGLCAGTCLFHLPPLG